MILSLQRVTPRTEKSSPIRTECNTDLFGFARAEGHRVEASFDVGLAAPNAGALLLGSADKGIGLIDRFSKCSEDSRAAGLVEHEMKALVGSTSPCPSTTPENSARKAQPSYDG